MLFGPFTLDAARSSLKRDGVVVPLGQHGYAVLQALVEAGGATVSRQALIERAWPGTVVEDGNLTTQVASLRKVLGPAPDGGAWIATVPRGGYRLHPAEPANASSPIATTLRRPPLAVLSFTNMSDDPNQEYFADGVVEDIITALARVKSFKVVARNSSFAYKGRAVDVRQVGADLGASYVLEGSIRRAADRLRVTAQLVETAAGAHLWAQNFDCDTAALFDVQDEIVMRVASAIEPQIRIEEIERAKRKRPESMDAYDLSLQSIPKHHSGRAEDSAEAYELISRSLALDPNYAPTLARAAQSIRRRQEMGWSLLGAGDLAKCIDFCWRAIALAPDDPMILAMCGLTLLLGGHQYDAGMDILANALKANPNNVIVRINCGIGEAHCGSLEKSLEHSRLAVAITNRGDHNAQYPITCIAHVQMAMGNYEEALRYAEQSVVINSKFNATYWMLISANAQLGQLDEARRWLAILRELAPTATVASIRGGQPAKIPQRLAAVLDGLKMAGLPEG